jgi:hypothetical protein
MSSYYSCTYSRHPSKRDKLLESSDADTDDLRGLGLAS